MIDNQNDLLMLHRQKVRIFTEKENVDTCTVVQRASTRASERVPFPGQISSG